MRLTLDRRYLKENYTIGNLYIDGVWFCNTMEDKDRGLRQTDSLAQIKAVKVQNETAIPKGLYTIRMDIVSPKYSNVAWYKNLCGGKLPRLMDVPGFDGILIHTGNTQADSAGCILAGMNKVRGKVVDSRETFEKLYARLKATADRHEEIAIKII